MCNWHRAHILDLDMYRGLTRVSRSNTFYTLQMNALIICQAHWLTESWIWNVTWVFVVLSWVIWPNQLTFWHSIRIRYNHDICNCFTWKCITCPGTWYTVQWSHKQVTSSTCYLIFVSDKSHDWGFPPPRISPVKWRHLTFWRHAPPRGLVWKQEATWSTTRKLSGRLI